MAMKKAVTKPAKKPAAGKPAARGSAAAKTAAPRSGTTKASPAAGAATHKYAGSCHCGRIAFEVEGAIDQVMDCNCSLCQRRGGLLWFVSRDAMRVVTPASSLWTYTFNKHVLKHHFCANCGIAPFSEGEKKGQAMAAINVRCLEGVDLSTLKVVKFDGRGI
jgi:hypothetical protein